MIMTADVTNGHCANVVVIELIERAVTYSKLGRTPLYR